jgi:hypothetical protein
MHEEEVTSSTNTRKKRYKSSFKCSNMKELQMLESIREYPNGIAMILVILQEH